MNEYPIFHSVLHHTFIVYYHHGESTHEYRERIFHQALVPDFFVNVFVHDQHCDFDIYPSTFKDAKYDVQVFLGYLNIRANSSVCYRYTIEETDDILPYATIMDRTNTALMMCRMNECLLQKKKYIFFDLLNTYLHNQSLHRKLFSICNYDILIFVYDHIANLFFRDQMQEPDPPRLEIELPDDKREAFIEQLEKFYH